MKVLSTAAVALLAGSSCTTAFAPSASKASVSNRMNVNDRSCATAPATCLAALPFFAQEETKEEEAEEATSEPVADLENMTMEEEVELLVQEELQKTKRMSNLRNGEGVEYAPWMGISEADENKIRSLMRDRTEARRKRQEEAQDVSGNLFRDSQAQELSGTGLSYKIINGEVELQWATKTEMDTKGFIVKRRAAKTNDYSVMASHADWGPLASKGKEGGVYRYLDSTATPGGWVYRISEEDNLGNEADVCQCLVEVETEEEQKGAVIAGVGFAVFAILAFVAGVALDPMNGNPL
mmetsp:Transcript_22010/g.47846  ORF Transcript_22010/g.47846 Transcript_22010/m.47846 type:complete len:295 (-) Transcript_22010:64-948(-)|eukprot:CAMPEP_0172310078 /NCGR_PEP_ID=MMETSP1058-20130122/11270_1 /TAXON_ID=83371 /ORGANISM="Detonula confervacea, Strain CCMP 353" /LENGTH=294 /DNA_ID=CAMNT_0013022839 /DNA_START=59 /DNA_END=943 /DNA_ORIENTATION=-